MRGVNIGGWLVGERWMTIGSPAWEGVPDDIANTGEYSTMKYLGHTKGDAQFESHRQNFITEQDFKDIAATGLNTLRIPVGYWITGFDNSGGGDTEGWKVYAPGAISYLDKAIREWAPRNNLLVFISFHAAKGSQNGADHSSPNHPGHCYWSGYPENVINTLDAVEWLAKRYKDDLSFLGIGLLNEPTDVDEAVMKQYYYDAYGRIRTFSDCLLSISPLLSQQNPNASDWNSFMPPPGWENVRHEWHRYQVWGFEQDKGWNADKLIDFVNNDLTNNINTWAGNWLFIGEWSIAASFGMDDDTLRRYAQAQLKAFSQATGGWTYWTWKTYNDDGTSRNQWSMKSMVQNGFLQ
uniref:glucan 1,3-beta-glucosidase n=1 Tax=Acrobeloides nanus TaxID=290746 RepID=A0A914EMZ5_9BILA